MSRIEKLEERLQSVNNLANSVALEANKELSMAKHKITCLTVLVVLFALIGASIAFYSIHSMKELFYDMSIEEEYIEVDAGDGGNATGIIGDGNEVHN